MNIKNIIAAFLGVLTAVLFFGCANSVTNPVTTGAINITVYKPLANDTINYKGELVIYDLTIDQGIKFIELYVNGNYVINFFPTSSGGKPEVKISLDSTYLNKRITYQLRYYDNDNKYVEGTVYSNVLVSGDRLPPYTPFGISLLQLTNTSFNLSWKDTSSGEIIHEIWRKAGSASDFSLYLTIPSGTSNINDEYIDPNQVYFYKIRGLNSFGYSDFSNVVNTVGAGGSMNLPPPRLLSAIATSTKAVRLTWQNFSTLQNYFKVERKSAYGNYAAIGIVSKTTTNFLDSLSGLTAGTQYWYRIKAIAGSDSSWSNELSVTTPALDIPAPQITSITNPTAGKVTISYNVNNNPWVDYSLIERKNGSGGTWAQIEQVATWISAYDDTTVQKGNIYYYRIRKYSVGAQLYSDYSNEMSIYVSLK